MTDSRSCAHSLDDLRRIQKRGLHEGIGALIGNVPKPGETNVTTQLRDDLLAVADAVPDLVEAVTAAFTFEEAFFRTALEAKACCFCGPLKRGYIHDDKCAFVDFANHPAVTHLKGNEA